MTLDMNSAFAPVVLITRDPELQEAVLRLAAAADVGIVVHEELSAARSHYVQASMVLVDSAEVTDVVAAEPARRPHVIILARRDEQTVWRGAVELGADRVVLWPDGEREVYELLVDSLHARADESPLICIVPGCGGAGASSLSVALAAAAGERLSDSVLLLDGDPTGGGLDVAMGAEAMPGLRWSDLANTSGRVSADSLRQALPLIDRVHLLSHGRHPVDVEPSAWESMISAGSRGFPLTVVDGVVPLGSARRAQVVVVVPAELRAVAAASARLPGLVEKCGDVRVVVRHRRDSDLDIDDVAAVLSAPVVGAFADARPVTRERMIETLLVNLDLFPRGRRMRRHAA